MTSRFQSIIQHPAKLNMGSESQNQSPAEVIKDDVFIFIFAPVWKFPLWFFFRVEEARGML